MLTPTPTPTPTPTTPNFNYNSPPFLIKIKRRANKIDEIKYHVKCNNVLNETLNNRYVLQGERCSPKLFTEFLQDFSESLGQCDGIVLSTILLIMLMTS